MTEKEKMLAGMVYSAVNHQLLKELNEVKEIIHEYNALRPSETARRLEILKDFPIQTVDGIECYIVAFAYKDANGNAVTENFAFSTVDGTLVKVF